MYDSQEAVITLKYAEFLYSSVHENPREDDGFFGPLVVFISVQLLTLNGLSCLVCSVIPTR